MSKKKNYNAIILYFLWSVQLLFLFYIKYLNQDLSFTNFSLFKIGNLINFVTFAGIIGGILLVVQKQPNLVNRKFQISFLIFSWFLLAFAFISTKMKFISDRHYIFDQPASKILTGLLFLIYLLVLIYFLTFLWSALFSKKKLQTGRVILNTFVTLTSFLLITLIYTDNVEYTSGRWVIQKNKQNIGVVLGAAVWSGNIPSPTLSSRVDKSIELLDKGFIGHIILTGGKAPGELPESEVGLEYAKIKGVDSSLISIESSTSSTADQIRWVKSHLTEKVNSSDIILISDDYHLPRVIEISKFYNLDIKVAESNHKLNFKDMIYNKLRECIALFNFWNFAL